MLVGLCVRVAACRPRLSPHPGVASRDEMLALLVLAPALLPSVAHRPQLAGGRRVARHPQLQLLASSASPKEEITPTAGLSVGQPHRSH